MSKILNVFNKSVTSHRITTCQYRFSLLEKSGCFWVYGDLFSFRKWQVDHGAYAGEKPSWVQVEMSNEQEQLIDCKISLSSFSLR